MAGEKVNKPVVQTQHGISVPVGGSGFGRGNTDMKMPLPKTPYIRPKKQLITQQGFVKGVSNDER